MQFMDSATSPGFPLLVEGRDPADLAEDVLGGAGAEGTPRSRPGARTWHWAR
jgi:hypothetical protein